MRDSKLAVNELSGHDTLPLTRMSPANPIEMLAVAGLLRSRPDLRASWPKIGPAPITVLHGVDEQGLRDTLRKLLRERPDIDWMPDIPGTSQMWGRQAFASPAARRRMKGWVGAGGVATLWHMISGRQILRDTLEKAWRICASDLDSAANSFFLPRQSIALHSLGWDATAFRPYALSAGSPALDPEMPQCVAAHLLMAARSMPAFAIRPGERGHGWMWIKDALYIDLPAPQSPTSWREWCRYLAHQHLMSPDDLVYRAKRWKLPGAKGRHHMTLGTPRLPYRRDNIVPPQPWIGARHSWEIKPANEWQISIETGYSLPRATLAGDAVPHAIIESNYMASYRVLLADAGSIAPVDCGCNDPAHCFTLRRAGGGRYDPLWTLHAPWHDRSLCTFGLSLVTTRPSWTSRVLSKDPPSAPWWGSRVHEMPATKLIGATGCLARIRERVVCAYVDSLGTLAPTSIHWTHHLRKELAIRKWAKS